MSAIIIPAVLLVAAVVVFLLYAESLDGRRERRAMRIRRRGGSETEARLRPDPAHPFDLEA